MNCQKAREQLSGFIDDELNSSERASLLEHLSQCPSCQAELRALQSVARMVQSLPEVNLPSDFRAQLYQRMQNEAPVVTPLKRSTKMRWYQWSVAAAAVLTLVWSARFASVKPAVQRPTDYVKTESLASSGISENVVVAYSATLDTTPPDEEQGGASQQEDAALAKQITNETPTGQSTFEQLVVMEVSSGGADLSTSPSFMLTAATSVAPASSSSHLQAQDDASTIAAQVDEDPMVTIQMTPNPSFTAPRNEIAGDRHRDEMSFGILNTQCDSTLAPGDDLRLEECVTRIRITSPSPDELRQRLRQLTLSERMTVVETTSKTRMAQFSIRGSAEQIARLLSQVSSLVTVAEWETKVVNLTPEWTTLQELIGQTRLEIARREALLRQTEGELQVDQQELDLQKARLQLQNHEQALRLLEARFGTSVLEVGY